MVRKISILPYSSSVHRANISINHLSCGWECPCGRTSLSLSPRAKTQQLGHISISHRFNPYCEETEHKSAAFTPETPAKLPHKLMRDLWYLMFIHTNNHPQTKAVTFPGKQISLFNRFQHVKHIYHFYSEISQAKFSHFNRNISDTIFHVMKRRISHNETLHQDKFLRISHWVRVFLQIPNVHQHLWVCCFIDCYMFDSWQWTSSEILQLWLQNQKNQISQIVSLLNL